jgi:uncharacterized protein (DUF697 family)
MDHGIHNEAAPSLLETAKAKLYREVLEIEKREDLSDDDKVSRIINYFGITCAAVAVQPIPFADIFVLTPIQAFMGARIAAIRGVPVSEAKSAEILKEISGVAGMGLAAQQIALGAYKTGLPFLAGFTTIPLVYGLTYGIGNVMDYYFKNKARGRAVDPEELKKAWRKATKEAKAEGRKKKKEVMQRSASFRD